MKLILCKPDGKPTVVDMPEEHDYLDIKRLLGIESPLTCVSRKIGGTYYDFWCDDEGLFPEKKYMCGVCSNAEEVICGNILIARHDDEGYLVGLTKADLEKIMDGRNFLRNEAYLEYVGTPSEDGDAMAIIDYGCFGTIFLKPMGYSLVYSV